MAHVCATRFRSCCSQPDTLPRQPNRHCSNRARLSNAGREVAVKILPEAFAQDDYRLTRQDLVIGAILLQHQFQSIEKLFVISTCLQPLSDRVDECHGSGGRSDQ